MLSESLISGIRKKTDTFWKAEVRQPSFVSAAQGKEIGHRIADPVDDKTTGLLLKDYEARFQRDKKGEKVSRSMADIWLRESDIFHPINIKICVTGKRARPNVVSMKRLLGVLLSHRIDSYYLLIVKFDINSKIGTEVIFIDLLDHLDYVTFDSGPGQIMLKAKAFYDAQGLKTKVVPKPMKQKVAALVELWEDGERRLVKNRKRGIARLRKEVEAYGTIDGHYVTPETQKPLNLQ